MAFTTGLSDTFYPRGPVDLSQCTLILKDGQVSRLKLTQEDLSVYTIPMTGFRVWDNLAALSPTTAAADDLGISAGTWGTNAPVLVTSDGQSAGTQTQYARCMQMVPHEWVQAETLQVKVYAGMETTVADTTATVDLEIYTDDGEGTVGSDLCATAAQSINTLITSSVTEASFTVTTTSLSPGDPLDMRFAITLNDAAGSTAVLGKILRIEILADTRG